MKKIFAALLCIVILLVSMGCGAEQPKRYQAEFLTLFDTVTTIVGYSDGGKEEFSELAQHIHDLLEKYHRLYDVYNEYEGINNIKTINDNAGKVSVKVDREIIDLLNFAKQRYIESDGKLNVAMGAVLKLWHDAREAGINDPENAKLPERSALDAAARHCNIDDILIDEKESTVYLSDPLMRLDVGGIAKGYAVEQVAKTLESEGVTSLIISVGGNVRAIGGKPTDSVGDNSDAFDPWVVSVQNPDKSSEQNELLSVDVEGLSVVTSGVYERYYTVDGKQYHHIIDPETLMPSEYYTSLTVVCTDSGLADSLATELFNTPLESALEYVKSVGEVEAMWVLTDGTIVQTDGFAKIVHN